MLRTLIAAGAPRAVDPIVPRWTFGALRPVSGALLVERVCLALLAATIAARLAIEEGLAPEVFHSTRALAALAAVAAALMRGSDRRWIDPSRAGLLLAALWLLPSVYPRLGGDGHEYYVLLRSPLIDGDLDFANDFQELGYRAVVSSSGPFTSRVTIGVALFWAPLVFATHVVMSLLAWLGADVRADGFSGIYQSAATTSSFLYGVAALVLLDRVLRRWFSPGLSLLTLLGVWLATPLYFYTVANPFMSHAVATFATTLFLLAWLRARESERRLEWLAVGAAGALMFLVRAPAAVLLVLPLLSLVDRRGLRWKPAVAYGIVPLAALLVQVILWRRLHGADFVSEVSGLNLIGATAPHFFEMLLSPRHGLFVWTPLYLAAVAGWALWMRRDLRLGLFLAVGFVLLTFVNSCFGDWWGSDAFGQRRLLDLTPFYAFGLAASLDLCRRRPLVPMSAAFAALVGWNLQFAYIYNSELAGPKDGPIHLDRLAAAQVDASYRRLLRWADDLPPVIWVPLYDLLKGVWLDEGSRSLRGRIDFGVNEAPADLPMLIGEGWFEPEERDGTVYRPTRGPRARLLIPIRTVADFDAVLHARLDFVEAPVDLELKVNSRSAGRQRLAAGWREYHFAIDAKMLQPGLNSFSLVFSATPRQAVPGFTGRNTVLAVDSLSLVRR